MQPTDDNHNKYFRLKVKKCSNIQSIWYIVTNDKKRIIITQDARLLEQKTGKMIKSETELHVKYMARFDAGDEQGYTVRVSCFEEFQKILKMSPKSTLQSFLQSELCLSDQYKKFMDIMNESFWIITVLAQVNEYKDQNHQDKKIVNFTIELLEIFDSTSDEWTEQDNPDYY